jgi:hypothetical protein
MAQVTTWLKRIGKTLRWHWVLFKAVSLPIHASTFELWLTDADNRVLRCKLEPPEIQALYMQLKKFFEQTG